MNVAHQIGGTLGLGILVVVFAGADASSLHGVELLNHRISAAVTGGGVMLFLALLVTLFFVMPATARSKAGAQADAPDVGTNARPGGLADPQPSVATGG